MRVAILTEIISPYRIPVFNKLATYPNIELKVLFASETEGLRNWRVAKERIQFDYEVLPGKVIAKTYQNGSLFLNPTIAGSIRQGKFDVIIFGGYHHPSYWLALAYSKAAGKRTILWSESNLRDHRIQSSLRMAFKRFLIGAFDRYLVPGTAQRKYLESFGVHETKIWLAPNAVDVDHFASGSAAQRTRKDVIKASLGITGDVILYVGRLIDDKGMADLLPALEDVIRHHPATLLVVGTGPDEKRYRAFAAERNLPVIFAGFQQQEDLPRYYAIADIFAFPTHSDTWGLVLNEAMSCGLPIVASSAAGAVDDLVFHGENGYIHPPGESAAIADAIKKLLIAPSARHKMGIRSAQIMEGFTPEKCAEGFRNVIQDED